MEPIIYAPLTDKELGKIAKRWRKDRNAVIYVPALIIGMIVTYYITDYYTDKIISESGIVYYLLGFIMLTAVLSVILFFNNANFRDYRKKQKFVIQAVLKVHEYRLKNPFVNIPLAQNLPFPIHMEVKRLRYINTLGNSSTHNTESSRFVFYLNNGLKYIVSEMAFVSDDPGAFLELHVARYSGRLLSVRKIKAGEVRINDKVPSIMQSLYSEKDFLDKIDELHSNTDDDEPDIIGTDSGQNIEDMFNEMDTKTFKKSTPSKPISDDHISGTGPANAG